VVQLAVLCFYKSTQKLPPFREAAVVVCKNEKLVLLGCVQGSLVFRNSLGELVGTGSVVFALDACKQFFYFVNVLAFHEASDALQVTATTADEAYVSHFSFRINVKKNLFGTGPFRPVGIHSSNYSFLNYSMCLQMRIE
jgi:hypothetical protein